MAVKLMHAASPLWCRVVVFEPLETDQISFARHWALLVLGRELQAAYADNYLIDTDNAIIVDVEASLT